MYELLTGRHPLFIRGEDKLQYRDKLRSLNKMEFPESTSFTPLALNLLNKLCEIKPSARYKLD